MPSHTYSAIGKHTVRLTVTDNDANVVYLDKDVTSADAGLVSRFRTKKDEASNLKIWFNGEYSHDAAGADVVYFQWAFGDGQTATEGSPPGGGIYDWLLVSRADRLIIWSNAGVWYGGVKGIPDTSGWTVRNVVTQYGATGNGTTNDTTAIQNAVNAAGTNNIIYFPAGTYRVTRLSVGAKNNLLFKGDGANQTTMLCVGDGANPVINFDGSYDGTVYTVTGGATKGSQSVTVSSASGLAAGNFVTFYPLEPSGFPSTPGVTRLPFESTYPPNRDYFLLADPMPAEVSPNLFYPWSYERTAYPRTGEQSNCEWFPGFGQIVEIASVAGTTINLVEPLTYDYTGYNPRFRKDSYVKYSGVEGIKFDSVVGGAGFSDYVRLWIAAHCWVKNCEMNRCGNTGVYLRRSKSCEITGNYIHHGVDYSADAAYLICMKDWNCDHYIYNNIIRHGRHNLPMEGGAMGNVIAYNYSADPCGDFTAFTMSDFGHHGRHPYMNLYEGNYAAKFSADNFHGSSSHSMLFRNRFLGTGTNDYGANSVGRICVQLMKNAVYHSLVGNVLGAVGYSSSGWRREHYAVGDYDRLIYYIGGNADNADSAFCNSINPDFSFPWTIPKTTGLFHGNYDYVNQSVAWDATIAARDIPSSLYLSAKPTFFGTLGWPAVGPDVTNYVQPIPASKRYTDFTASNNKTEFIFKGDRVIDHTCCDVRKIPDSYITAAKANLHIAYGTASHGTQIPSGMGGETGNQGAGSGGLVGWTAGWGGSKYSFNSGGTGGALDYRWFHDFGNLGISMSIDLLPSSNPDPTRTAWVTATQTYLASHPEVNVVWWAWCYGLNDPANVAPYITRMEALETQFPGVTFIYASGRTNGSGSGSGGYDYQSHKLMRDSCSKKNKWYYDFFDIESWNPSSQYFVDLNCNENCDYTGGNWATNWQNANPGQWYTTNAGDNHTQPLNENLKAYAAWHLFARLAGWDGKS